MGDVKNVGKDQIYFGASDVGCYADGAYGLRHVREKLAELIRPYRGSGDAYAQLREEMSDDDWETSDALDMLNRHTMEGYSWTVDSGDLLLISDTEGD